MKLAFDFHDSEVRAVRADGDGLCVSFSAAVARRPAEGGGGAAETGHVRNLEMLFSAAHWSGPLDECFGRLSGGRLAVAGTACRTIPLPWAAQGPVRAELAFGNGTVLSIGAAAVALRFTGEPGFAESLAC